MPKERNQEECGAGIASISWHEGHCQQVDNKATNGAAKKAGDASVAKGSYVGIHSSSFKDLLLLPEIQKAITDCGFEHPSDG